MKRYGFIMMVLVMLVAVLCPAYITDVGQDWRIKGAVLEDCELTGSTVTLGRGESYYVDGVNGDDAYNGLSWATATASITQAITLSNANVALTGHTTKMNRIYISGGTYTEDIEAFPANCHVIGTGTLTRIQNLGTHTCAGVDNCHFWNISFRGGTSGQAMVSIANSSHSLGFHKCIFESQATISSILYYAGSSSNQIIEDCELGFQTSVGNSPDIAVHLYGVHCQRMKIIDNRIWSTGVGVQIENMASGNFLLIKDNVIAAGPGSTDSQMAYGIKDLTSSPSGGLYINNYISAADALYFTVTGNKSKWMSINNYIVQAGTGDTETDMSD